MSNEKDIEFALAETLGRTMGVQFREREEQYDADWQRYITLRREVLDLEADLNITSDIIGDVLNQPRHVIKPIVMQYPLGTDLQDMVDVVAQRLNQPGITLRVFDLGRQDFVNEKCRVYRSKAGKIHWRDSDDEVSLNERWADSYIAGWNQSERALGKKFHDVTTRPTALN